MKKNRKMEKDTLEVICFKAFLRVIAHRRHYAILTVRMPMLFGFHLSTLYKYLTNKKKIPNDSILYNCASLEDVVRIIRSRGDDRMPRMTSCSETAKEQYDITSIINFLLHNLIEGFADMTELQSIGQEIFDTVCRKRFGEDFKDETGAPITDELSINTLADYFEKIGMPIDQDHLAALYRTINYHRNPMMNSGITLNQPSSEPDWNGQQVSRYDWFDEGDINLDYHNPS